VNSETLQCIALQGFFLALTAGTMPGIHETRTDVVIVGAGAAGLAAARRLREHGVRVVILEARDRLGGRIHTVRHPQSALPIELGAEFLHGDAEEVLQIAKEAGLTRVDVTGERWRATGRRFSRIENYWERLDRILGQADAKREPDRSLAAFLAEQPGGAASPTIARWSVSSSRDFMQRSSIVSASAPSPRAEIPAKIRRSKNWDGYSKATEQ
jgi:monoamine oxidase